MIDWPQSVHDWYVVDTLAGPVVTCRDDCRHDEAQDGALIQCSHCEEIQKSLRL